MKISAVHIANLFAYGHYQGIRESDLRKHLIVGDLDVCLPQNTVSTPEFLAVFETLIDKTNNEYFGLYYGCYLNIKALGLIAQLSLNATSIEQAIFFLQEYLKNTFPIVSLSAKANNAAYELRLECPIKDITTKNHLLDIAYCFVYRELKLMLGNEYRPTLQLPYLKTDEYANLLGSEVTSAKSHVIQISSEALDTEINKKSVNEIELLLPQFMQMLDNKNYDAFSLQIRNMVLSMCSPEIPTFDQVSNQFPYSDRTIQRKLTAEGQSFRSITDDIKRELSNYLSKGKKIKTQDIAYILGYSEPSAYLHAVKRWKKVV